MSDRNRGKVESKKNHLHIFRARTIQEACISILYPQHFWVKISSLYWQKSVEINCSSVVLL